MSSLQKVRDTFQVGQFVFIDVRQYGHEKPARTEFCEVVRMEAKCCELRVYRNGEATRLYMHKVNYSRLKPAAAAAAPARSKPQQPAAAPPAPAPLPAPPPVPAAAAAPPASARSNGTLRAVPPSFSALIPPPARVQPPNVEPVSAKTIAEMETYIALGEGMFVADIDAREAQCRKLSRDYAEQAQLAVEYSDAMFAEAERLKAQSAYFKQGRTIVQQLTAAAPSAAE